MPPGKCPGTLWLLMLYSLMSSAFKQSSKQSADTVHYGVIHKTRSTVHNILHCTKISWSPDAILDMQADRPTDTLITILCTSSGGKVSMYAIRLSGFIYVYVPQWNYSHSLTVNSLLCTCGKLRWVKFTVSNKHCISFVQYLVLLRSEKWKSTMKFHFQEQAHLIYPTAYTWWAIS